MTEEPFKGLVFMLHDQSQFEQWLRIVLSQVRYAKGIVQKLANSGDCPGKAAAFNHSTKKADEKLCEAAVKNALKKVGVKIK